MKRTRWYANPEEMARPDGVHPTALRQITSPREENNLISSLCDDGLHRPLLDIDYRAKLVASSTEGHYHLYLDGHPGLSWRQYRRLLRALARAGVIQRGFCRWSVMRGHSLVRRKGVYKLPGEAASASR